MDKHTEAFLGKVVEFCEFLQRFTGQNSAYPDMMRSILMDSRLPKEFQMVGEEDRIEHVSHGFNQNGKTEWGEIVTPCYQKDWEELIVKHGAAGWSVEEEYVKLDLDWCRARRHINTPSWSFCMPHPDPRVIATDRWMPANVKLTNYLNSRLAGLLGLLPGFAEENARNDHHGVVKEIKNKAMGILSTFIMQSRAPFVITGARNSASYAQVDLTESFVLPHDFSLNAECMLVLAHGDWKLRAYQGGEVHVMKRSRSVWQKVDFEDMDKFSKKDFEAFCNVFNTDLKLKEKQIHPTLEAIKSVIDRRPTGGYLPCATLNVVVKDNSGETVSKKLHVFADQVISDSINSELRIKCRELSTELVVEGVDVIQAASEAVKQSCKVIDDFAREKEIKLTIEHQHVVRVLNKDGYTLLDSRVVNPKALEDFKHLLYRLGGYPIKEIKDFDDKDLSESLLGIKKTANEHRSDFVVEGPGDELIYEKVMGLIEALCDKGTLDGRHIYKVLAETSY